MKGDGDRRARLAQLWPALLVFAGCYLGARIDTALQFPHLGTAFLFPPYAILTAALLRSPPRRWWLLLVAASLGNFLPHRDSGASLSFVLLAEVANHARALVAAAGLRRFSRADCLDTFAAALAFLLFAVLLGPAVGGLIGAGVVILHGKSNDFWLAWYQWSTSNAITGLTILPMLIVPGRLAWPTRRELPRIAEGVVLSIGLLAVGAWVFLSSSVENSGLPWHLYAPLPLLLWAAVRFGATGASAALLGVTVASFFGTIHGLGPFVSDLPSESLLQLQLFLAAVAMPLMLLTALVDEQRRTASALRESREQFRSVVEDQTEMIFRFLPDGTCTFVNGAFCRYFDHTPAQLIGKSVWPLLPLEAEHLAAITADQPVATRESRLSGPNGELRWQQWRDRGLFDEGGRILEYQSVGRDITERKRAEDQHSELEAKRQVEAALREADRHKDDFLATLGHELRNPLAPIIMAVGIIRRFPNSPQATHALDAIARQAKHMTCLVDDLLDVSRIARGKIELHFETVDLASAVTQALETTRPLMLARQHEIRVSLPETPVAVRGDAVRLAQVVVNLLNNAAKYSDPGGRVEVSVVRETDCVLLSVRDRGIGIAPEMLARIFEPFTQAAPSREVSRGGLGIGLALVKQIVELHHGEVEARSAGLGQGSELLVRLPALPSALAGAAHKLQAL